jgi:hypothetical protein
VPALIGVAGWLARALQNFVETFLCLLQAS